MVTSISFSAARPLLATIAYDGTAHVYDTNTWEKREWQFDSDNYSPHAVAISPNGEIMITASFNDKEARVWSWKCDEGTPQYLKSLTHEIGITSAAFNATGRLVMTTSLDRTARIWDLDSGELVLELPKKSGDFEDEYDAPVRSAAFSPDGELVVTASGNKARIWRTCQTGGCKTSLDPKARGKSALLRTLEGHRGQVTTASFDISGERVVTASADGAIRIWDVATGDALQILPKDPRWSAAIEHSAFNGHDNLVLSVAFDPAGTRLVTASQDRTAPHLGSASGAQFVVLTGHNAAVFSAAFSSDGRKVVTGSFDKMLRLWDAEKRRESLAQIDAGKPVLAVTFTSEDSTSWLAFRKGPTAEPGRSAPRLQCGTWTRKAGLGKGRWFPAAFRLPSSLFAGRRHPLL